MQACVWGRAQVWGSASPWSGSKASLKKTPIVNHINATSGTGQPGLEVTRSLTGTSCSNVLR